MSMLQNQEEISNVSKIQDLSTNSSSDCQLDTTSDILSTSQFDLLSTLLKQANITQNVLTSTKPKCDKTSEEFRELGNKFYVKREFIEAAEMYNKSLCFAESPELLAAAYANRSAVCYELNLYSTCLENIELAKLNSFPPEKIQKLNTRAEKARQMVKEGAAPDKSFLEPSGEEFLELTHPSHPKLPYIADCLDVKFNEEFGRHVITNKQLLPGDIICVESPFASTVHPMNQYKHCLHCLDNNFLSLIPCILRTTVMFCSKCMENMNEIHDEHYKYQLEIIDELKNGCSINLLTAIRVFFKALKSCDGNLEWLKRVESENYSSLSILSVEDPNDPVDQFRAINSLQSNQENCDVELKSLLIQEVIRTVDLFMQHTQIAELLKTDDDEDFFRETLLKFSLIAKFNAYEFGTNPMKRNESGEFNNRKGSGSAIFPFLSHINHSCDANVILVDTQSKFYLIVLRVIEAGEQIFEGYCSGFDDANFETRQKIIRVNYMFNCKCQACVENFPMWDDLPMGITDKQSRLEIRKIFAYNLTEMQPNEIKDLLERICKLLMKHKSLHPCRELVELQDQLEECFVIFIMPKLLLEMK